MADITKTNSLENKKIIKRQDLNPDQYTASLLSAACKNKLIDRQSAESIQLQILMLLKELIDRYTMGESSSIAVDTAENLLMSIYYCIDIYTSSFSDPNECIEQLMLRDMIDIYQRGVEMVTAYADEAVKCFRDVRKNKLDIPLVTYNSTVDEALPAFFSSYGIVFNAQNTVASIDYPLVFDDMSIKGILYIKNYIETLEIETRFCRYFSKEDYLRVLKAYGKLYGIDYVKTPINLFEILMDAAIFSILSGNHVRKLLISENDYQFVYSNMCNRDTSEVRIFIEKAFSSVISELSICDTKLINYIIRYQEIFSKRLLNAIENHCLMNMVLIKENEDEGSKGIIFKPGERMSDIEFRKLIDKIRICKNILYKIRLINENITSLYDFIDILEADCLYGDEIITLYSSLGDSELTVLGIAIFYEQLRDDAVSLDHITVSANRYEKVWQADFIEFIKSLDEVRRRSIESGINQIRYSDELLLDYTLWI